MEQYSLGCRRQASLASLSGFTETFTQIHGEIRDIELLARYNEGNALADESRTVIRAEPVSNEDNNTLGSRANQSDVLFDVGRRGGIFDGHKEDTWSACDLTFLKTVHPGKKRGETRHMFECNDLGRYVKRDFKVMPQCFGNRGFGHDPFRL